MPVSCTPRRAERILILDGNLGPFTATLGAASILSVGRIGAHHLLLTKPHPRRFGQIRDAVDVLVRLRMPPATVT